MHGSRRSVVVVAVASLAISLGAAGCGSGDDGAGGGSTALTVALSGLDASQAEGAVAEAKGYFKEAGLEVEFVNSGSNVVSAVVSGQADIGSVGLPGPMLPAGDGKNTSIIAAKAAGGSAAHVAAKPGVSGIKECKSVATAGVGTVSYGWTKYYEKAFGLGWSIKAVSSATDAVNLMVTGQVDCSVLPSSSLAPVIKDGKAVMLVSPTTKAGLPADFPTDIVGAVLFGLPDNLKKKKEAVVAFLAAWNKAVTFMGETPEQASEAIRTVPGWDTLSAANVRSALDAGKPFRWPNQGKINAASWPGQLEWFVNGGTALKGGTTAEVWSFDRRVDMSYLDQAISAN
ncbi:ABC transporter substrate-binding protein [Kribbella lupini]|uniref:SsuA/THI5-like domain-containing protein n=1 Tax=Kribbella lupini TaxID=291602 RepID=A0ABN2CNN1_9ACTN